MAAVLCDIDRSIAETLQDLFIFINLIHSLELQAQWWQSYRLGLLIKI